MENKKQNESQELSAQELANLSGGIAVGEYYPGKYPTDNLYSNISEAIAKKLENIKLPGSNDKTPTEPYIF
jgi:hypothetical protein